MQRSALVVGVSSTLPPECARPRAQQRLLPDRFRKFECADIVNFAAPRERRHPAGEFQNTLYSPLV